MLFIMVVRRRGKGMCMSDTPPTYFRSLLIVQLSAQCHPSAKHVCRINTTRTHNILQHNTILHNLKIGTVQQAANGTARDKNARCPYLGALMRVMGGCPYNGGVAPTPG